MRYHHNTRNAPGKRIDVSPKVRGKICDRSPKKASLIIRDRATIADSVERIRRMLRDADVDLTKAGVNSIANALLERKEELSSMPSFEGLRDLVKEIVGQYTTPKAREILEKVNEFDRMFKRDPRPNSKNAYWAWEKLLQYVYNIILRASGNKSPDVPDDDGKKKTRDRSIASLDRKSRMRDFEGSLDQLGKTFVDYISQVYGKESVPASYSKGEGGAYIVSQINVPGTESKEDFQELMNDFCDEYDCSYSFVDQAPQAKSRQYFPNVNQLYEHKKSWEAMNPGQRKIAMRLWKESWGSEPFDPSNRDDAEEIVLLYNSYMDELREWNVTIVRVYPNREGQSERQEDYKDDKIRIRYIDPETEELVKKTIRRGEWEEYKEMYPDAKQIK